MQCIVEAMLEARRITSPRHDMVLVQKIVVSTGGLLSMLRSCHVNSAGFWETIYENTQFPKFYFR